MRKLLSIFTLVLFLLVITSCGDDNNTNEMTHSAQLKMLNNSVNLSQNLSEKVSTSTASILWDITNSTITLDYSVPIDNSTSVNISVKEAKLTVDNTLNCYTFVVENAGAGITQFRGYYRPEADNLHIEFIANGTHRVFSTVNLYFPYTKYSILNTEMADPTPIESDRAGIIIQIDPSDMSANILMGAFALDNTSYLIQAMQFNGLQAEATADGYKVTLTEDKRSTDGNYTLNQFEATVTGNGRVINGTFILDSKYNATFSGTEFYN